MHHMRFSRSGFTLYELLIVVAIVAILGIATTVILNPAELLRQSRDTTRLSDMTSLGSALSLYQAATNSSSMGTSTVIYVSLPDKTLSGAQTSTCSSLGLVPPAGYTYRCSSPQNFRKIDGTGWIPLNIASLGAKSPISALPMDPVNNSSTAFYEYVASGTGYAITTALESQQYLKAKASNDGGVDPVRYETGTNLALIAPAEGLAGWWPLTEGTGATAYDQSGNKNNGSYNSISWAQGKIGAFAPIVGTSSYAGAGYVSFGIPLPASPFTLSFWANPNGINTGGKWGNAIFGPDNYLTSGFRSALSNNGFEFWTTQDSGTLGAVGGSATAGVWNFWTISYANGTASIYQDGALKGASAGTYTQYQSNLNLGAGIGGISWFWGKVNDVRIYNRALAPAEIQAIYNAEK